MREHASSYFCPFVGLQSWASWTSILRWSFPSDAFNSENLLYKINNLIWRINWQCSHNICFQSRLGRSKILKQLASTIGDFGWGNFTATDLRASFFVVNAFKTIKTWPSMLLFKASRAMSLHLQYSIYLRTKVHPAIFTGLVVFPRGPLSKIYPHQSKRRIGNGFDKECGGVCMWGTVRVTVGVCMYVRLLCRGGG